MQAQIRVGPSGGWEWKGGCAKRGGWQFRGEAGSPCHLSSPTTYPSRSRRGHRPRT